MDYTELVRRTPAWLYAQNRDIVAEMPVIIAQAHEQLFNIIDHDFFRTKIDGITLTLDGILDLDTLIPDLMEVRAIRLQYRRTGEWTQLYRRDLEMLTALYSTNRPGRPRYYAEYAGPLVVQVFPQPAADYTVEVTCNVRCPVLSPTTPTNLLGDKAERALEKATFRQAALYMKDTAAAQTYEAEMTGAVAELNAAYGRRRRDDTGTRPVETANRAGT